MNQSANDVNIDGRTQKSIYSKNTFQNEEENDGYGHQIPQGSFEGVHGVNEDYEEEEEFGHGQEEEEFEDQEYEEGYQEEGEVGYFPEGEQNEEEDENDDEYPKVGFGNFIMFYMRRCILFFFNFSKFLGV